MKALNQNSLLALLLIIIVANACSRYEVLDNTSSLPPLPLIATKNNVTQLPLGSDPRYGYYDKYINAYIDDYKTGIPIISTDEVEDEALKNVKATVQEILSSNTELNKAIVKQGGMFVILDENESVADNIALVERAGSTSGLIETGICYQYSDNYKGKEESVGSIGQLIFRAGLYSYDSLVYNSVFNVADSAESSGIYHPENTWDQEQKTERYFTIGVEVWFGIWKGYPSADNGRYDVVSRTLMETKDTNLYNILKKIFIEKDWNPCNQ